MGYAEVLPVELRANDLSAPAWRSFKAGALDAKGGVEQLKNALAGFESGGLGGVSNLGKIASLAKNPYIAMALAVAGVGLAASKAHDALLDMADAASKANVSATEIDGLSAAIRRAGGDAGKAAPALITLQESLNKNARDGGFLEDLFKLNGSSLNDAGGKVKEVRDAYGELAGFIHNARNEQERLEIATAAYGADAAPAMVKAIMAGADSLERFKSGAALDPAIQQAREFERLWAEIAKSGDGLANSLRNAALPAMNALYDKALEWADVVFKSNSAAASRFMIANPGATRAMDNQNDIDRFYNAVGFGATKTPSARKPATESFSRNEFDRAVNAIGKHVAIMEADAAAVGKTAGEHERLRIEAQLLDAAQRAGIEVTGKQKEKFDALAAAAKSAADSLAVAKLQNDLMFERDQFGRSPTEQVVSSKLRSSGIDPNSEQGQMLAGQIRINEAMKTTQEIGSEALKGFIADLRAGKSAGDAFAGVLDRIAAKLTDKALDSALSGLMGGVGKGFGSIFSGASTPAQDLAAGITPMHTGGIIGSEKGGATRYVHPAHFNDAPRFHSGLMPDEFPAILQKGEGVFTKGQMSAMGGRASSPRVNVTVINNAGANVGVGAATPDGNGGLNLEVMVDKMTAKNIGRPGSDSNRAVAMRGALTKR